LTRCDSYAEGNIANKLIRLDLLEHQREILSVWLSRSIRIAHAWRIDRLRFAGHFDSIDPSDENEVPLRKNSNSRVHTSRHYYCDRWLDRELKHRSSSHHARGADDYF